MYRYNHAKRFHDLLEKTMKSRMDRAQQIEIAAYIATLSGELALMARRSGLSTLGYLLDMAKLEAEQVVARSSGGSPT